MPSEASPCLASSGPCAYTRVPGCPEELGGVLCVFVCVFVHVQPVCSHAYRAAGACAGSLQWQKGQAGQGTSDPYERTVRTAAAH